MNFDKNDNWYLFHRGIVEYFSTTIDNMLKDVKDYIICASLDESTIEHYNDLSGKLQKVGKLLYTFEVYRENAYIVDAKYSMRISLFPTNFHFEVTKFNDPGCTRTFGNIQDAVLYILVLESLRGYGYIEYNTT